MKNFLVMIRRQNLEYDNLVAHIKVVKIDQLTLRCYPAESSSQEDRERAVFRKNLRNSWKTRSRVMIQYICTKPPSEY